MLKQSEGKEAMATVKEKKITVATKEVKAKPVKKSSVKPSNTNNIDLKPGFMIILALTGLNTPRKISLRIYWPVMTLL